jgi:hypothetical protein
MIGARMFQGLTNFITAYEKIVRNGGENMRSIEKSLEIILSDGLRNLTRRTISAGRPITVKEPI